MANPSKRKGSTYELAVAVYLAEHGHPQARRTYASGPKDEGDIGGVGGFAVQCKNRNGFDLAGACDEAKLQAANAGAPRWMAVLKRRLRPVQDSYVVMDLATAAELIEMANRFYPWGT